MNDAVDAIFAENLGRAFGGCVRDQTEAACRLAANAAGVPLSIIPFVDAHRRRRLKLRWAAALCAIGRSAAFEAYPELAEDEVLRETFERAFLTYADTALARPVFEHLPESELRLYVALRHDWDGIFAAQVQPLHALAHAFLTACRPLARARASAAAAREAMKMANSLFHRLAEAAREAPLFRMRMS